MLGSSWSGVPDPGNPQAEPYNLYRYTSKRWDPATGDYDMGFRDYNPTLNRFLSRDTYNGALADLNLGTSPWTGNRYAFTAGNPTSFIERDGHGYCDMHACAGDGATGGLQPSVIEASTPVEDTTNDLLGYELPDDAPDADVLARDIGQHNVIEQFRYDWGIPKGRTMTQQETISMLAWYCGSARELCGESLYNQLFIDKFEDDLAFAFSYGMIEGATALGVSSSGIRARLQTAAARNACSFDADTHVVMADGSTKPISDVKIGDEVLATDPETGERAAKEVTRVWVHEDTVVDLEVEGEVVTTTEDHPFWNHTDWEWQPAEELDRGDQLLSSDGTTVTVQGLIPGSQALTTAFNLSVADIHTYYVVAGDTPVLVHNAPPHRVPNNLCAWLATDSKSDGLDGQERTDAR